MWIFLSFFLVICMYLRVLLQVNVQKGNIFGELLKQYDKQFWCLPGITDLFIFVRGGRGGGGVTVDWSKPY